MRAISAADAISPAIQRTKEFLFRPFNWGTFLKLGLVRLSRRDWAAISGRRLHRTTRVVIRRGSGPMIHSLSRHSAAVDCGERLWRCCLLLFVIGAVIFYLITRLRFAFFHCLVHNTKEIRPGWQLYREQASRFFWLNS